MVSANLFSGTSAPQVDSLIKQVGTVVALKTATRKAKDLPERARREGGSALVIAAPLVERHGPGIQHLQEDLAVCEVTGHKALVQVMASLKPAVLVVDLALPGLRGVRGLPGIQRLSPFTKIVALADTLSEGEGLLALKSGAKGYCARTMDAQCLGRAIAAVQKGEIWAPRKLVPALIAELVSLDARKKEGLPPKFDARLENLTERQRVVADLISRGASNKEVANRLKITERTVKAHLTGAFRNVGVSDRLQLALLLQGHPRASQ